MAMYIPIYPGSASFFPGDTPFGIYDYDYEFQEDCEKIANWCATRLGYPIVDVELQDKHFFTAFEEAISEYSNQINTYQGRDNILNLLGFNTGSVNLSNKYFDPSLKGVIRLSKAYGTEAGSGGNLTWYSGSLEIEPGKQTYNLHDAILEKGSYTQNNFTIRKILHYQQPAVAKYLDPSMGTGLAVKNQLSEFGWDTLSTQISFLMFPLYYDILRLQSIELNDQIRKSHYSFHLSNERLRVYPIPSDKHKLWFYYTLDDEIFNQGQNSGLQSGKITNISNLPYYHFPYSHINDIGKQWIKRYTLALSKEMLGLVRGKYSSIPVPNVEVTLNGSDLLSQAQTEKDALITELKEILDQYSRQAQLERKAAEGDTLMQYLTKVPMKIYVK